MSAAWQFPEFDRSFLPVLDEAFDLHAARECVRFGDARYSFAEVDRLSCRIANALIRDGFAPGDMGAVYSLNSALSFMATLGIIRAGGVWIPVNPRNSEADNLAILERFRCDVLLHQEAFDPLADQLARRPTGLRIRVCINNAAARGDGLDAWLAGAAADRPSVNRKGSDTLTIPLTGGTTGLPKGVMLSHRNFCGIEHSMRSRWGDRDVVQLTAAPMTHVGGRMAVTALRHGARVVIMESVDIGLFLALIEEEGVTDTFLPPTGVYSVLEHPDLDRRDLSSLVSFSYGSAPIATERLREALLRIGPCMRGGFGQTEAPMIIATLNPEDHFVGGEVAPNERLRSVGRATESVTLTILDESGAELPAGERGEIALKGPNVSEGYFEAPEETARIRVNGWHLTGDIGYLDEAGFLYIVDRKKDMIITGGFNVYSSEVEQALAEIPGVTLAAVIGVPSDRWGEEVKGFVVADGRIALTEEQIIADVRSRIGSVKAPKSIEFVEDFPRTPVGKIDKKAIRAPWWRDQERAI